MKVTVAFGDVKVVVPCGSGDITIRHLADLAITRYKKSLQKDMVVWSNSLNISIMSLVLARDNGILDWDDNVKDVIDDRELITAKYQCLVNSDTTTVSQSSISPEIHGHVENIQSDNNPVTVSNNYPLPHIHHHQHHNSINNPHPYYRLYSEPTAHNCDRSNSPMKRKDDISITWPVPPPLIAMSENNATITTTTSINTTDPCIHIDPITTTTSSSTSTSSNHNSEQPPIITNQISVTNLALNSTDILITSDYSNLPYTVSKSITTSTNNSITSSTHSQFNNNLESISLSSLSEKQNNSSSHDETAANTSSNYAPLSSDSASDNIPLIKSNSRIDPLNQELSDISEERSTSALQTPKSLTTTITPTLPPPMPPLRSAFTKLTTNPLTLPTVVSSVSYTTSTFQSLQSNSLTEQIIINNNSNNNNENNNNNIDSSSILSKFILPTTRNTKITQKPILNNNNNNPEHINDDSKSSKQQSEQSIPSLFESSEAADNEWSISGRSGDVESNGTTATTTISTITTNITTTSTSSDFNNNNDNKNLTCLQPIKIDDCDTINSNAIVVKLKKSSTGFGFSLTSRHNPVDQTNPVYVSKVLENGPAITDGQMKAGDQIVMINDENVTKKSQKEVKEILLNQLIDSIVKIVLIRPTSDSISSLLFNSRTLPSSTNNSNTTNLLHNNNSTISGQQEQQQQPLLNNTGDNINNKLLIDYNNTSVDEQKPVNIPICKCVSKQSQPCSRLSIHHFVITLRSTKTNLIATPNPLLNSESITTTNNPIRPSYLHPTNQTLTNQNSNITSPTGISRVEPPAITLHHQNKLSPTTQSTSTIGSNNKPPIPSRSSTIKTCVSNTLTNNTLVPTVIPTASSSSQSTSNSSTMTRASQATLGISVRRGTTQMSHTHHRKPPANIAHLKKLPTNLDTQKSASKLPDESVQKFCPNCHGLLIQKNGVYVKSVIPGGAAHHDGRLLASDELVAVQGICLYNCEEFQAPNNRELQGDHYDPLRYSLAHLFQTQLNLLPSTSSSTTTTSTTTSTTTNSQIHNFLINNNKIDPLALLKQILNYVQNTATSVSLIVLRRSLNQRSCSINSLASNDVATENCHNVTVSADIHTPIHYPQGTQQLPPGCYPGHNEHPGGSWPHKIMTAATVGSAAAAFLSGAPADPLKIDSLLAQPTNQSSIGDDHFLSMRGERAERWDELHSKYHHERYYRNSRNDDDYDDRNHRFGYESPSTRSHGSSPTQIGVSGGGGFDDDHDRDDLICLQSADEKNNSDHNRDEYDERDHERDRDKDHDEYETGGGGAFDGDDADQMHHYQSDDYDQGHYHDDYDDHANFSDHGDDEDRNNSPTHSNHLSSGFITDYDTISKNSTSSNQSISHSQIHQSNSINISSHFILNTNNVKINPCDLKVTFTTIDNVVKITPIENDVVKITQSNTTIENDVVKITPNISNNNIKHVTNNLINKSSLLSSYDFIYKNNDDDDGYKIGLFIFQDDNDEHVNEDIDDCFCFYRICTICNEENDTETDDFYNPNEAYFSRENPYRQSFSYKRLSSSLSDDNTLLPSSTSSISSNIIKPRSRSRIKSRIDLPRPSSEYSLYRLIEEEEIEEEVEVENNKTLLEFNLDGIQLRKNSMANQNIANRMTYCDGTQSIDRKKLKRRPGIRYQIKPIETTSL